jgi:hypothetical protein
MRKRNFGIVLLLSLSLLFAIPILESVSAAGSIPTSILSQGLIVYNGIPNGLVYSTGFETAYKLSSTSLYLDPDPVYNYSPDNYINTAGTGSIFWVEGYETTTPGFVHRPGSTRCLASKIVANPSSTRRAQLDLYLMQGPGIGNDPTRPNIMGTSNEFYFQEWMFISSDFALTQTPTANWYGLWQITDARPGNYVPFYLFDVYQLAPGDFRVSMTYRDQNFQTYPAIPYVGNQAENIIDHYPLPLGVWFKWGVYMYRHETDGIIKVWINDNLIMDLHRTETLPLPTKYIDSINPTGAYYFNPLKNYGGGNPVDVTVWIDDLEIWEGMPS